MSEELEGSIKRMITLINIILVFVIITVVVRVGVGIGTVFATKNAINQVQQQVVNMTESTNNVRYRY